MVWILAILAVLIGGYELYVSSAGIVEGQSPNFQSPSAIYGLAINAGFEGSDATTAVAIALAESSGNAGAYNPEYSAQALNGAPDGKGSFGLWQIYLFEHPEFEGQNLYDPQTNANAAFSVYEAAGNSFKDWTTLGGPRFLKYLPQALAVSGTAASENTSEGDESEES